MNPRHNKVRETVINQQTINCASRIGIKISTLHHDNVESKVMLKNLNRHVKATHSMFHLTIEMIRNGNTTSNGLKSTMEKFEQEIGRSKMRENKEFENNSAPIDHLLNIKSNNFIAEKSVNYHMIECKKINLE